MARHEPARIDPRPHRRESAWRPHPARHSIQEIVVHAAYWKYAVRRRLKGEKRGSFPLKGSDWFRRDRLTTSSGVRTCGCSTSVTAPSARPSPLSPRRSSAERRTIRDGAVAGVGHHRARPVPRGPDSAAEADAGWAFGRAPRISVTSSTASRRAARQGRIMPQRLASRPALGISSSSQCLAREGPTSTGTGEPRIRCAPKTRRRGTRGWRVDRCAV